MDVVLKYLPREMLYTLMNPHFTIKIGKNRNIYILIYSNGENTQKFFTNKSNVPDKCMGICGGIITFRRSRKYMKTSLEHSEWKQPNDKTLSTKSFNSYVCTCMGIETYPFSNFGKYMHLQFVFTKQFNCFCSGIWYKLHHTLFFISNLGLALRMISVIALRAHADTIPVRDQKMGLIFYIFIPNSSGQDFVLRMEFTQKAPKLRARS